MNGAVGLSYVATPSSIDDGVDATDRDAGLFRDTDFDDVTFSDGGAGLLVPVRHNRRTLVFLDLGARFHNNGRASYLREGGIEDRPGGDIALHPIRGTADLWAYHEGGRSWGVRPPVVPAVRAARPNA